MPFGKLICLNVLLFSFSNRKLRLSALAWFTGLESVEAAKEGFGSGRVVEAFDFMVHNIERKSVPAFPDSDDDGPKNAAEE